MDRYNAYFFRDILRVALIVGVIVFLSACTPDGKKQECGTSYATPKTPVSPIVVDSGQANTTIIFFESGFSATDFIPSPSFTTPSGVAVSSNGTIYVTALGTYRIAADGTAELLAQPGAFYLVIGSDGNLYTDSPNHGNAIMRITPEGVVSILAQNLSPRVAAMGRLAASPDGYIYADIGAGEAYNDATHMIRVSIETGDTETVSTEISGPKTFDSDGTLYVVSGNWIYSMGKDDTLQEYLCFEYPGDASSDFYAIVIDANGDFLVSEIAERTSGEPVKFTDQVGTRIFRIERSTGDLYTYADGLYGTAGLAVHPNGNVIVAQISSGSVGVVDSSGTVSNLVQGNLLSNTMDICFDHEGSLFITNAETATLSKAEYLGDSQTSISPFMIGFNLFSGVNNQYAYTSICFDSADNLYVAEYAPDIIRKGVSKIPAGSFQVESFTTEADSPNGLTIDNSGNIWVANAESGIIQKFSSAGTLLATTQPLNTPSDITWYDGNLYVAEYGGNRIVQITPDLSAETYAENVSEPVDLAFSEGGDLVVTSGGTLYFIEGPPGNQGTVKVLASYPGSLALQGVVFDEINDLYLCANNGTILTISGPFK